MSKIDAERFAIFQNGLHIVNTDTSSISSPKAQLIEIVQGKIYDSTASSSGYLVDTITTWANTLIDFSAVLNMSQVYKLTLPNTVPNGLYLLLVYDGNSAGSTDTPERCAIVEIADGKIKHLVAE